MTAVCLWLQKDARRTGVGNIQDWGFFLWLFWPVLIPVRLQDARHFWMAVGGGPSCLAWAPMITASAVSLLLYGLAFVEPWRGVRGRATAEHSRGRNPRGPEPLWIRFPPIPDEARGYPAQVVERAVAWLQTRT